MSTKKQKMVIKNTAQNRSAETTDQLKKGIARVDRNKSSINSEPVAKKKGVKSAGDRNATSMHSEPVAKKKGVKSAGDRNATSMHSEPVKKAAKKKALRDPNATIDCTVKKTVKRTNTMQGQSSQESGFGSKPGVARGKGMHDRSTDLGIEKKAKTKKMISDKGAQSTQEKKTRGVKMKKGNMHDTSDVLGHDSSPKPAARKVNTGTASAFSQTSHEAVPGRKKVARTGKMNQQSVSLGLEKNTKSNTKRKPASNASHHTNHTDLFGGGKHKPVVKAKQTTHMESSFTFG